MARVKYKAKREDRLAAITKKYFIRDYCSKCGKLLFEIDAFSVVRWSSGKTTKQYQYCKSCAKTKEDVLILVDRDEINYGIAFVDDFFDYVKEDSRANTKFAEKLIGGLLNSTKV